MGIHDALSPQAFLSKLFWWPWAEAILDHGPYSCFLWMNEKRMNLMLYQSHTGYRHHHTVGPASIWWGEHSEKIRGNAAKFASNFMILRCLHLAWLSPGKPNSWIKPITWALRTEMIKDTCVIRHELGPNNSVTSNGVDGWLSYCSIFFCFSKLKVATPETMPNVLEIV